MTADFEPSPRGVPEVSGKSLLSTDRRRFMPEQTVREPPDSFDRPPFTEAEAEAMVRAWNRIEERRQANTLRAAAEVLIERENERRPLWELSKA